MVHLFLFSIISLSLSPLSFSLSLSGAAPLSRGAAPYSHLQGPGRRLTGDGRARIFGDQLLQRHFDAIAAHDCVALQCQVRHIHGLAAQGEENAFRKVRRDTVVQELCAKCGKLGMQGLQVEVCLRSRACVRASLAGCKTFSQ